MRTRVAVAALTVVVAGILAGCDRTTAGTVAMTTEAGPSTRISTSPRPTTSAPRTSSPQPSSDVPPPCDALAVTCKQYGGLDQASRTAVIQEIPSNDASTFSPEDTEIATTLADAMCTFLPESTVAEILLGGPPR
jgi:hypothetical protein